MASSFSDLLRLELQADGENDDTWGVLANRVFELIEASIAGAESIAVTDSDVTLTTANGTADQARKAVLLCSGTLTGNRAVIVPAKTKLYVVRNATAGAYSLTVKTSAGTGIAVPQGFTQLLMCDGTNVISVTPPVSDSGLAAYLTSLRLPEVSAPTNIANSGFVYTKDVSGATELFFMDASGNETQITTGGKLNGAALADTSVPSAALAANITIAGAFALSGAITPPQITANTDNYNPDGLSGASALRLSTDASRNVTGIAGGSSGRMLLVGNVGSNNLVLVHDATSTAANRFSLPSAANLTLLPGEWAVLRYDATLSRWVVVASTAPTRAATETNAGAAALAAQAEAEAGTNDTKALTPLKLRQGLRAGGSAPVYAARAWVNFDGTLSSGNIRNSGNVSSVTRHATGDFSVNFATALPHADYAAIAMAGGVALDDSGTAKSTSAFRYSTRNLGGTFINWANNGVVIFC